MHHCHGVNTNDKMLPLVRFDSSFIVLTHDGSGSFCLFYSPPLLGVMYNTTHCRHFRLCNQNISFNFSDEKCVMRCIHCHFEDRNHRYIITSIHYSCGLSTATIEYSCPCFCVCVCVSLCVCVCVCLCVSVCTITQKIMVQST